MKTKNKPKVNPQGKIRQYNAAGLKAFNETRAAEQSTWSRIDEATLNAQCNAVDPLDEIED